MDNCNTSQNSNDIPIILNPDTPASIGYHSLSNHSVNQTINSNLNVNSNNLINSNQLFQNQQINQQNDLINQQINQQNDLINQPNVINQQVNFNKFDNQQSNNQKFNQYQQSNNQSINQQFIDDQTNFLDYRKEHSNFVNQQHNQLNYINQDNQSLSNRLESIKLENSNRSVSLNSSKNQIKTESKIENAVKAMPDIICLLNDNDPVIVHKTMVVVYYLVDDEKHRNIALNSNDLVDSLIKTTLSTENLETLNYTSAIFHKYSLYKSGLDTLFNNNILPALYKLLDSNLDKLVEHSVTTLHNLILKKDGVKNAIRLTGGIPVIIRLLDKKKNKFLAVVMDCLQLISFRNQDNKIEILRNNGTIRLINILNTDDCLKYEKLIYTTLRCLKVLSVCPRNKLEIIRYGGLQALAKLINLEYPNKTSRLILNCLWTIRNLSDAASDQTNINDLLLNLVRLLQTDDPSIVICSACILGNLTCNNQYNKQFVYQLNGINILIDLISKSNDRSDILEPVLCTLRNLTIRHQDELNCQKQINSLNGLILIVKLLTHPTLQVIKQTIGLIGNIAKLIENNQKLRELGVISRLMHLLSKQHQEIKRKNILKFNNLSNTDILIVEIIMNIVGCIQILSQDQESCQLFLKDEFISILFELLYYEMDDIQKVTIQCLKELCKSPEGIDKISTENYNNNLIINNLSNSLNQCISKTCQQIQSILFERQNGQIF